MLKSKSKLKQTKCKHMKTAVSWGVLTNIPIIEYFTLLTDMFVFVLRLKNFSQTSYEIVLSFTFFNMNFEHLEHLNFYYYSFTWAPSYLPRFSFTDI